MSYEEKGVWVYFVAILGTCGAYLAVILRRADGVPLAEVAYVSPMLWTIGVAIALSIVGRVVVAMVRPSENYKSDARDKDIDRFGEYAGGVVLSVAMVVPFGLALAAADHFWIAHAMYAAFVGSALVSTATKLVAYRRGM